MKKLVLTLIICSFFAATSVLGQQWSGPDNTTGSINRSGNVGIGISTPVSRLDIKSDEYPVLGGGYDYVPQLRLQSYAFHQHTAVTAAYPSAHGFKSPNDDWRTIMAYPCPGGCTRIPFWSNPNISFAGNTMGTTVTHNNTAMIEDKFPNVMSLLQPEDALLLEQIDVIADDADIIANKEIETNGSVEISPTQSYSFRAGEKITFKPGFKVQAGTSSQFVAEIVEVSECGEPDGEEADYGLGEDITMDILKQPLSFELFPNPANEIITISYKSIENNVVSISVTDFVGKEYLKLEKVILLDNELEKTLNISNLSSGIYFMTIYTNKGKLTKKFYKQ